MVNSFKKVIEIEMSMRFWKERMKIRLNGFGKLGDFLGMGSCDAPVSVFADGDSTAEESLRCMPRTITPYRGVINESRWGEVRSFSSWQGSCGHFQIYSTLFLLKRVYLNRNLARDIVVLKPA